MIVLTEIYPKFAKPSIKIAGAKNIQHNAKICSGQRNFNAYYKMTKAIKYKFLKLLRCPASPASSLHFGQQNCQSQRADDALRLRLGLCVFCSMLGHSVIDFMRGYVTIDILVNLKAAAHDIVTHISLNRSLSTPVLC